MNIARFRGVTNNKVRRRKEEKRRLKEEEEEEEEEEGKHRAVRETPPPATHSPKPRVPAAAQPAELHQEPAVSSLAGSSSVAPSLSSIAGFLTCPKCSDEFSADDDRPDRHPLHSFACDHIVCGGCALSNDNEGACPECGVEGAFDPSRPVVSRAYLGLVRRMREEMVLLDRIVEQPTAEDEQRPGGGRAAVPSQICVPSPTAAASSDGVDEARRAEEAEAEEDQEDEPPASGSAASRLATASPRRRALGVDVDVRADGAARGEDAAEGEEGAEAAANSSAANDTSRHQEPTTPVSRAEYRFLQRCDKRKEKLAQSLEKVNRILERSRANRARQQREQQNQRKRGGGGTRLYEKMILEGDEGEVEDEEGAKATAGDAPNATTEASSLNGVRDEEQEEGSRRTSLAGNGRARPELRVDTGETFTTPTHRRVRDEESMPNEVAGDEAPDDENIEDTPDGKGSKADDNGFAAEFGSFAVTAKDEHQRYQNDIFRMDSKQPQLVEFGTAHLIAQSISNGSSLTSDNKDDTLSLLAENRPPRQSNASEQGGGGMVSMIRKGKIKDYRINNIISNVGSALSSHHAERQDQGPQPQGGMVEPEQQREQGCPQFLPSLNYSTMREEDEFVGLVRDEGREHTSSPVWGGPNDGGARGVAAALGPSNGTTSSKRTRKSRKSGGGRGLFNRPLSMMSHSFDEAAFFRPVDLEGGDDEDRENERPGAYPANEQQLGTAYEFCEHSCSASPSSREGDEQRCFPHPASKGGIGVAAGGDGTTSLVTHRPRLRKKVLNALRGGG